MTQKTPRSRVDPNHSPLVSEFEHARRASNRAVLEGFHAVKHALRFGADLQIAVSNDLESIRVLAAELAPDLLDWIEREVSFVETGVFKRLTPRAPPTRLLGIAHRPALDPYDVVRKQRNAPIVALERPTRLGNVGAVIRLSAALGAAGVITTGPKDPWDPQALRGSAGLHYAIPVARWQGDWSELGHIVAIDPGGEPVEPGRIPDDSVLLFGTEREGISAEALRHADLRLGIPMRPNVSSLNLATAVAIVLYSWSLGHGT